MKNKATATTRLLVLYSLLATSTGYAQVNNRPVPDTLTTPGVQLRGSVGALASTGNSTPFWFRANQFGTVPWETPSGFAVVGTTAILGNPAQARKPYLKFGVEVVGNLNRSSRLILPEAYGAIRLGHGELYVGRRKEINGLTDTLLSSGSIAWSGNALPITQVRLGTTGFAPLRFTKDLIAVNAFFSHGWFADSDSMKNVWLHAKAVFLRIGKPTWKVRLYGGINHYAQWGGYSAYLPKTGLSSNGYIPSSLSAYRQVVFPVGKGHGNESQLSGLDSANQVGNHLGSIDVAFEVMGQRNNLFFYYQHLFEDNSGIQFANFPDGLWGVRWKNGQRNNRTTIQVRQATVEFLTSLDRSGTSPVYGRDDYFFNGQYLDGWVHKKYIIGTPIFTRTADIPIAIKQNSFWLTRPGRPVSNNAVQTIHAGFYLLAFERTALVLFVTANRFHDLEGVIRTYDQLYSSLEIGNLLRAQPGRSTLNLKLAYDAGQFLGANVGAMLTYRKVGFLQ